MRIFSAPARFALKATGPILAVGLGSAAAQTVSANDRHTLAIASQPLPQALAELSSTTGLRVFYESEAPYQHISKPLQGSFTTDEALRILLSGTGISARQVAENAVTLDFVATTAEDIVMDEILVLGELRTQSLQDTQTSTVVISGEELDRSGDFDIKDVFERTPNVTSANGDLSFTIRGIEARGVGADGSGTLINVQIDGASLPTQESITFGPYSTWDLEQVEILRGPQSTQQGRNALAGAVIFRSNDPTYDYELKGRGEIGNRETFGGAIAFNAPVIEDVLAVRFSAEHKETDGFVEAPTLGIDDYDPDELTTLRGKVLFEPVEGFSAILGASFSRNRTGEDAISFAEFPGRIVNLDNEAGEEGNDTGIFTLRMSYDLSDSLTLESETTGIINDYIRVEDLTGPVSFGQLNIQQDSSSWSQELRLVYENERVSAVAGGFATGISSQTEIAATIGADFLISSLPPTIQFIRSSVSREETLNVAFFGEAEIEVPEISDGFSIIVGGRYDRETIDFESEGETQVTGELPFPLPIAGSTSTSSDTSFDAFLPKIGIVYDWSDDLSTGFTVQRGYRAGGTFESTVSGAISEWDPEFTWNYEFALRSQWFDRRLTANANLFYTEWTDQQVTVPNPSGIPLDFRAANAGESRLFGGELALSGTPIPELELFGSVGVTDTKFTDFVSGEDDFTGNRFTYAPVVSAAFGGRYFFDNGVSLGVDASYTGATFSQLSNSPADRVDSRFLLNASLGYETENWAIEAYVRNLLDNEYLVQQNSDDDFARAGEPLTFGLIGRFQF